jgi:DNA (cytosine-5)-methyltransferase 1
MTSMRVDAITFGSLFAGIGGFDLGLERAGMVPRWQVEIDPWCRKVLAKHWPDVPKYEDVKEVGAHNLEPVDVICGGFPCQNISSAGRKEGITGTKSGLWTEYARIVRELRPQYVIVENVGALTARGLSTILGDLAESGYDAEWESLPAAIFGAPHIRNRTFILGYSNHKSKPDSPINDETRGMSPMVPNAERAWRTQRGALGRAWGSGKSIPWDGSGNCTDSSLAVRVDDGVSHRMDRLRGLGNAVVPQVVEWIGRRIVAL